MSDPLQIILVTFAAGLALTPLANDFSKTRISYVYNVIMVKLFHKNKETLSSEERIYRKDGTLASIRRYYSGVLEEELLYRGEEAEMYARYTYDKHSNIVLAETRSDAHGGELHQVNLSDNPNSSEPIAA